MSVDQAKGGKLAGWDLYEALGKPQKIVAPMVDQSELAWRILSRRYGAELVYTPMINARQYSQLQTDSAKKGWFDKVNNEEGLDGLDRPLIVQFAANDPQMLLDCAKDLEGRCDAVDLNLGCPQVSLSLKMLNELRNPAHC